MIKKEFKCNFKGLLIWCLITILFLILIFAIYPSVIKENENMSQMMEQMFSKEILALFNMDIVSFDSVFGWLASEGYVMLTLLLSSYFAILGGTIVLKEHSEKTIYFLYSKPISKRRILSFKIITGLTYAFIFNLIIALTNLIGLYLSNDLDLSKWFWISIMPFLLSIFIYLVSLFISIHLKKTSTSIGVSLGIVFLFYILNVISLLSDKLDFIKYLSPFYYIDARNILENGQPNFINIIVLFFLSFIFMLLSYFKYDKKEMGLS